MRRAYKRSGCAPDWTGTHVLRHTAATRLHQHGASIKEIADVLGHRSIDTSLIYTKVDLNTLGSVALPWPGEGQS
jgi:site-specific recombinase XerD